MVARFAAALYGAQGLASRCCPRSWPHAKQGCLTAAGRPAEDNGLTPGDVEIELCDGLEVIPGRPWAPSRWSSAPSVLLSKSARTRGSMPTKSWHLTRTRSRVQASEKLGTDRGLSVR